MWSVSASHLHCHAQFSNPPTRAGPWTMEPLNLQPSQPQCPPTPAGSSDRGGCRMGRPAAGWDSYWAFERWARSSHLPNSSIMPHKRTQIKRTHSCLRSHYHIQALYSLFSPSSLSLCEPRPGEKKRTRVQALPRSWRPWERQKKTPGGFLTHISWYRSLFGLKWWAARRTIRSVGE